MAVDIFETRTLFGAINEGRFGARAYFRDRFFNRIKTFVTENIDFDLKDAQGRKAGSVRQSPHRRAGREPLGLQDRFV